MFKLCFNSTTLRNMDLFVALKEVKAAGYDGVELTMNRAHMNATLVTDTRVKEVRSFCEDLGLPIVCAACSGGDPILSEVPYEPSLISADPAGRQRRIDYTLRSMEIANLLGSPVLNINSGILRPEVSPEQGAEYLREGITTLLKAGGDLILVIEPEPGFHIGTTATAIPLIQSIDSPRFRLNLDIGHVFCCESDPYKAIEKALPYSRHIHIEDIKGNIHHHEIPGEGDIDFDRIIPAIVKAGYSEYVSVELHHHDTQWERALKESRDYLCKKMAEVQ